MRAYPGVHIDFFKNAMADDIWNKEEKETLAAIIKGLEDEDWNFHHINGDVDDGTPFNHYDPFLTLRDKTVFYPSWMGTAAKIYSAKGHKPHFLVEGNNIGVIEELKIKK